MNFNDSKSAMLLLTDQGTLQPGSVKTLYLKRRLRSDGMELYADGMGIGDRREFVLGDERYRVRIAAGVLRAGNRASILLLERGGESQPIWYQTFFYSDNIGELDWVGDMDGDNKLDLQFSSFAPNGGQLKSFLFLSSFAQKGQLIGFAGFSSTRCTAFKDQKDN